MDAPSGTWESSRVNDDHITSFVSGGQKNYAYQTKNDKTVRKMRGFTLNHRG